MSENPTKKWNRKNRRVIEKTREYKDFRNARLNISRFFRDLSFKDKLSIVQQIKPELYTEYLERYLLYCQRFQVVPQGFFNLNGDEEISQITEERGKI